VGCVVAAQQLVRQKPDLVAPTIGYLPLSMPASDRRGGSFLQHHRAAGVACTN